MFWWQLLKEQFTEPEKNGKRKRMIQQLIFISISLLFIACSKSAELKDNIHPIEGQEKCDDILYRAGFKVNLRDNTSSRANNFFPPYYLVDLYFIRKSHNEKTAWFISDASFSHGSPFNLSEGHGYLPTKVTYYYVGEDLNMEIEFGCVFTPKTLEPKGFYSRNGRYDYDYIQNELAVKDTLVIEHEGFKYDSKTSHIAYKRRLLIKNVGPDLEFSWMGNYDSYYFNAKSGLKEELNMFIEETPDFPAQLKLKKGENGVYPSAT